MEQHDTHLVSEQSKEEHAYKYDKYGNIIVDSIDDLIYDKFVEIKPKNNDEYETKKFIKNIVSNNDFSNYAPHTKRNYNFKIEENQKKKSLINICMNNNEEDKDGEIVESEEESDINSNIKQKKIKNNSKNNKNNVINNDSNENNYENSEEEEENEDSKNKVEKTFKKKILNKNENHNYNCNQKNKSESNSGEDERDYVNQKTAKKLNSNVEQSSKKNSQKKSKNLNNSDDPVNSNKKINELKRMFNKKCFISKEQANVHIRSQNDIKPEKEAKITNIKKHKNNENIENNDDNEYYENKELNLYNYYIKNNNNNKKYEKFKNSDFRDDVSKTDDRFLDSEHINIRKNSEKKYNDRSNDIENDNKNYKNLKGKYNCNKIKNHERKKLNNIDNYNSDNDNDVDNDNINENNLRNESNERNYKSTKKNNISKEKNRNAKKYKNEQKEKNQFTFKENYTIKNSENEQFNTSHKKKKNKNNDKKINYNDNNISDESIDEQKYNLNSDRKNNITRNKKSKNKEKPRTNIEDIEDTKRSKKSEEIYKSSSHIKKKHKDKNRYRNKSKEKELYEENNNYDSHNNSEENININNNNIDKFSNKEFKENNYNRAYNSKSNSKNKSKKTNNENDNIDIDNINNLNMISGKKSNKKNKNIKKVKYNKKLSSNDSDNDNDKEDKNFSDSNSNKIDNKNYESNSDINDNINSGRRKSNLDQLIYNKPIIQINYIQKIRKDKKMNLKPPKLNRVFITKTYTINNITKPILIPKINFCYMIKSPNIIIKESKKDFLKKSVINDFCFYTKLLEKGGKKYDSNYEDAKYDILNKKKKVSKKKKTKKKKQKSSDDSYISVSVDNKNIFQKNKFKEDFIIKNEFLVEKYQKSTNHKTNKNRLTLTNNLIKNKKMIPSLNFEKIKKYKDKYTINDNNNDEISTIPIKDRRAKIRNINDSFSSIEKVSNNEIDSNENKDKKNEKNEKKNLIDNKPENGKDNSTRIRVHKYNKNHGGNANIKINVKNPPDQNIEYQQIEIKPGIKGYYYRVIKKASSNNFRNQKNFIKARNSVSGNSNSNNIQSIKIKSSIKPIPFKYNKIKNINKNTIEAQTKQIQLKRYPLLRSNKSFTQNSKIYDSQLNLFQKQNLENNINNANKETHHMMGYERHFGIEENCPLCKNMKKKNQYMEEMILGPNKKIIQKPNTVNQNKDELYSRINNNFNNDYKKEEEKNINNNNIFKDLNLLYSSQSKNRLRQNMFKDIQRRQSAKKNISGKLNMFKITTDHNNVYNRNNLGSFSDLEFPAINSYFHS